jgi:hypothetical protein
MLIAMPKAILMLLLAVVSSSAMAEWVEVSHNKRVTVYADPATISSIDNIAKMWALYDYKSVQAPNSRTPYRSSRKQSEYDCKEEKSRILSLTGHSGNMAEVDTVFSLSKPEQWEAVPHSSLGELIWKIACGKP